MLITIHDADRIEVDGRPTAFTLASYTLSCKTPVAISRQTIFVDETLTLSLSSVEAAQAAVWLPIFTAYSQVTVQYYGYDFSGRVMSMAYEPHQPHHMVVRLEIVCRQSRSAE